MIVLLFVLLAACFAAAFWQGLAVRTYTEKTDKVKDTVRLMVIADLHSTLYGSEQSRLADAVCKQAPDALLFVGDIADDKVPHDGTKQLFARVGRKYPCFYVAGNHEFRSGKVEDIKEMIRAYGVTVLAGNTEALEVRGQKIRLCGVDDPVVSKTAPPLESRMEDMWTAQFNACSREVKDGCYSVLLTHRPERVGNYRGSGFDLVVAGHAHGGQVRIPGILNGLFAPNQGLFPKYAGGRYELAGTVLIVSRGLCKNWRPRVFNPPELVVVNIEPAGN